MKKRLLLLKPLSILPALALLWLIFRFSAQTGEESGDLSYAVSLWLVSCWDSLLCRGASGAELAAHAGAIHLFVRKAAHMTEYCLLGWSVSLPCFAYQAKGRLRVPLTLLLCTAAAALDEYHQSFVAGRGPSLRDVGIDCAGVLIGLILLQLALLLVRRRRRRKTAQSK